MKEQLKRFLKDESGLGTVELVLLILILAGLALAFKGYVWTFLENLTKGFDATKAIEGTGF